MRAGSVAAMTLSALLVAIVPCSADENGPAPLVVAAEGEQVTIEGVQPGASVAVLGVIRRSVGTIPVRERWAGLVLDEDNDGRITIELEQEVLPNQSVWIAVDTSEISSMAWTMSQVVVAGAPLPPPAEVVLKAESVFWQLPAGKVEAMVVHPLGGSVGAWEGRAFDGGSEDMDRTAGSVGVAARSLRPTLNTPELLLLDFDSGDLVVAIEPETFQAWVARVGKETD